MPLAKAKIVNLLDEKTITVMFNPAEYVLTREVDYTEGDIRDVKTTKSFIQFSKGHRRKLSLELFFDTTNKTEGNDADVSTFTSEIEALMDGKFSDNGNYTYPKLCFEWGSFKFRCVLSDLEQRFTRFDVNGIPKRAILRCTFLEDVSENKKG